MADTPEYAAAPDPFDLAVAELAAKLREIGAPPAEAEQAAKAAISNPTMRPSRMQPPDATGVRAGQMGLPPLDYKGPEMRARDPVSTGDLIARNALGDSPSPLRRKVVEGITGHTGLGESDNVPVSAFDVTGINPLLNYENKLAAGDKTGAALELAPFALAPAGRVGVSVAERMIANPKTTAVVMGAAGLLGAPSEAGPGDKAPTGQSLAPTEDRLRELYQERATLARQMDEVRKRRDQNRPSGRAPTRQADPNFTAADDEYKGLEAKLSGLEAIIEREGKRGSPQALADAQKIQAETDAQLAKKRSETPTRELYPELVSQIPYYTGLAGLALGSAVKARKTYNYNNTVADISNRTADAVDEAYNALAGKRTPNKLAEAQLQTKRAEMLGQDLANTKAPGFFDPKVSGVGGLTGLVGAFAPEEIDLARGGVVADKVFENMYSDPMKMAKRAAGGFVLGMAPAEIGGAATWAAMQGRKPPGFGPETAALRDALDRAGVPRYPNQGVLGLPQPVQGGRLEAMPGPTMPSLPQLPGTVIDQGSTPVAGSMVPRNRLAGDFGELDARGARSASATQSLGSEALSNRPASEILGSIQRAPKDVPTSFPDRPPSPSATAPGPEGKKLPPHVKEDVNGTYYDERTGHKIPQKFYKSMGLEE